MSTEVEPVITKADAINPAGERQPLHHDLADLAHPGFNADYTRARSVVQKNSDAIVVAADGTRPADAAQRTAGPQTLKTGVTLVRTAGGDTVEIPANGTQAGMTTKISQKDGAVKLFDSKGNEIPVQQGFVYKNGAVVAPNFSPPASGEIDYRGYNLYYENGRIRLVGRTDTIPRDATSISAQKLATGGILTRSASGDSITFSEDGPQPNGVTVKVSRESGIRLFDALGSELPRKIPDEYHREAYGDNLAIFYNPKNHSKGQVDYYPKDGTCVSFKFENGKFTSAERNEFVPDKP